MVDKPQNDNTPISPQEQWRNLCNALSEDAAIEPDVSCPDATHIKQSMLERLAHDDRAQLTPSEISSALEQSSHTATNQSEPLRWPEAKEPEPSSGNKGQGREAERDKDIDHER